jgi:hypothetical protein
MEKYPVRKVALDYDIGDVRRRYLSLSTGQVYDALSESGLNGRAMEAGIYPLVPAMKVAGPGIGSMFASAW